MGSFLRYKTNSFVFPFSYSTPPPIQAVQLFWDLERKGRQKIEKETFFYFLGFILVSWERQGVNLDKIFGTFKVRLNYSVSAFLLVSYSGVNGMRCQGLTGISDQEDCTEGVHACAGWAPVGQVTVSTQPGGVHFGEPFPSTLQFWWTPDWRFPLNCSWKCLWESWVLGHLAGWEMQLYTESSWVHQRKHTPVLRHMNDWFHFLGWYAFLHHHVDFSSESEINILC